MHKEELIEQYFSGHISEEAFLQLKTLLEEDDAFKKEFYSQLEIQKAIAQEKQAPLKERLKKLDQKPIRKINWYRYAAAAAILIAIGFIFYRSQPNFEKLYAANFEAYPNVIAPTVRDNGGSEEDEIATAFSYYDNRRYADAASAFEKLYKAKSKDYAFFYYSISLMAMGDTQKSITALENHDWTEPGNYQTISHWYLGLAYLKLQNKEKAKAHLEKVAHTSDPLAKKATELLKKLE